MRHWRGEAKTLENIDLRERQTARYAETCEAKEAPAPGPVWRDELEQEEEQSPEASTLCGARRMHQPEGQA